MSMITRLLSRSDPAQNHNVTFDARAEAELEALLGPTATPVQASITGAALRTGSRMRPLVATAVVALVVAVATIAALTAVPEKRTDVGRSPSPTPTVTASPLLALNLAKQVWHVQSASGEAEDTWLRFAAHDVRVLRGSSSVEFGWRAQGTDLLFSPDRTASGQVGSRAVRWLEVTTSFQADASGYDLLDERGRLTARLVPTTEAPVPAVAIDGMIRETLADARPGAVRPVDPATLHGTWKLPAVARSDAEITFRPDGVWTTTERCASAPGSETDLGHYRLLRSGILLSTTSTGQDFACQDDPPAGAAISTIGLMLRARSIRVDGNSAVVYDSRGTLLGRLQRP